MDTKVADPLHGALLGERYRIMGWLAQSGLATMYVARDERLDRTVAIKLIHSSRARDPGVMRWLTDQTTTAAKLTHPNVVAVYDQGVHADAPYIVMEFVRGRTLREVLDERHRLDPADALAIAEQSLAALTSAHRNGLVHRDVNPDNILIALPPNGSGDLVDAVVKVTDFGLAEAGQVIDETGEQHLLTAAEYLAPETVRTGQVDPRSDVYSVGVVLYEMLAGRAPFVGRDPTEVAWRHVHEDLPPPSWAAPAVPAAVDWLVAALTRRDPDGRPRDATEALALVQSARDEIATNAGAIHALEHPTVVVPSVDARPSWARLPAPDRYDPFGDGGWGDTALGRVGGTISDRAVRSWQSTRQRVDVMRSTPRGRQQLTVALVIIAVILLGGGWWLGIARYTQAPPLIQLTRDNAIAEATRLGFTVDFAAGRYDENIPVDTVLDQRPSPGSRIVRGGTVTLVLCLGPERYAVPDVSGQATDFATTRLKDHFVVQLVNGYSDTLPVNYVVGTIPVAGTPLKPNSVVKVIVAKGPNPVHVPEVTGKPLSEAQSTLEGMGFTVEVQRRDDQSRPRDQVIEQTPPGGQGMATATGVTIVLVVANGPPGPSMPQLLGASCNDAIDQLKALGLQVNVNGNAFERFFWSVKAQHPDAGQPLEPGQNVDLQCG